MEKIGKSDQIKFDIDINGVLQLRNRWRQNLVGLYSDQDLRRKELGELRKELRNLKFEWLKLAIRRVIS